jgi:predicted esterase
MAAIGRGENGYSSRMPIGRRALAIGLASALAARRVRGEPSSEDDPLEIRVLRLEHEVLLALPRAHAAPLVVLMHGLAETSDEHTGARAWVDRYGLVTSVRRLLHPPLAPISGRDDWGGALSVQNAALAARPFHGLGFACPFVPRMAGGGLDAYARWVTRILIPRVRAEAGDRLDASPARIGGCSYGGWISLELFLRAPEHFGAWAGVQTAIAREAASGYADRLARLPAARPLFIETSTRDPFHDASVALADALRSRKIPYELNILPGPHDQPWLRESGTPCALAWIART